MASIPTVRSFNQILSDMLDALCSRLGIPKLPPGDPILSILEAAAQSDFRNTQDVFQLLNSIVLDRATGLALDRIGADEDLIRLGEAPATGTITVTDTSFTKKSTSIYQGLPAPIVGATTIHVVSALGWPGTGNIYLGRGTTEYEGPVAYTAAVNNTTHWTLTLPSPIAKFHNLGTTVVLAQGGNRSISSGAIVQTPQGNAGTSVQFSVQYPATIPDGEVSVSGVSVIAQKPGTIGNVGSLAITGFATAPFVGATASNGTAFTNGRASEDDNTFRERIRTVRQTKQKATSLAIKSGVVGAVATDENRRILSSSLIAREGHPLTLYIDDGSGYEEKVSGTNFETIVDSAFGGERYFSLVRRPVAKAFVQSTLTAPFNLVDNSQLAVKVGGVTYTHIFISADFRAISSATAYEIASSVNSNPLLGFNARTVDGGTKVALYAIGDVNEDIEVVSPTAGAIDANTNLGFSSGRHETLFLYKNDILLTKDGSLATLNSDPQSYWGATSDGETLEIAVDGTPLQSITINDSDFVDAGTPYSTVASSNSLESWAAVLNSLVSGVTFAVGAGVLSVTSNLGRSDRAKIDIQGGTLVSNGLFTAQISTGSTSDYSLNRNLSQIGLSVPLVAGDRLTAGSYYTRAFIQSSPLGVVNLASDAELWLCVDGAASIVKTGLNAGAALTFAANVESYGRRVRITAANAVFANVQPFDWLIINDSAFSSTNTGAFRITRKDVSSLWIEIERQAGYAGAGAFTLNGNGFTIVRSSTEPQRIVIPTGTNYTALTIADSINTQLIGAEASVYQTTKLRITTNTSDGDIALVAQNTSLLGLTVSDAAVSAIPHLASVISGNTQAGTPSFSLTLKATSTTSPSDFTSASLDNVDSGSFIVADQPAYLSANRKSNKDHVSMIEGIAGNTFTLRDPVLKHWLTDDLVYHARPFAITPNDSLAVLVDSDEITHRYDIDMYRKVKPATNTYGITNDFKDATNGTNPLALYFGLDFDWTDFAVYMKARTKTNLDTLGANTSKSLLVRYSRFGPEGNLARFQWRYPDSADQSVQLVTTDDLSAYTNIQAILPSGSARTGVTIRPTSTKFGLQVAGPVAGLYTCNYVVSLDVTSMQRTTNVTTATVSLPGAITNHGLQIGDVVYVVSTDGAFSSGTKVITARTNSTFSWADSGPNAGPNPNNGSVSNDSAGEATLLGSTVAAGDIWSINWAHLPYTSSIAQKLQSLAVNKRSWITTADATTTPVDTAIHWYTFGSGGGGPIGTPSFYPLDTANSSAAQLSADINALDGIVSTAVLNVGSGTIDAASYETVPNGGKGATDPWYYLTDGMNWVQSQVDPVLVTNDYTFTFKNAITTSNLASDADWENEEIRLVPQTVKNLVNWLGSTATSGLSSVANAQATEDGQKLQIVSRQIGRESSVQIQGGSANSLYATARSTARTVNSTNSLVQFNTSDVAGLSANQWACLQNQITAPKPRFTSGTVFTSIDTLGNVTLGSDAWDWAVSPASPLTDNWEVIKNGKYVQIRNTTIGAISGVSEGDWAFITVTNGSSANEFLKGVRIVRFNSTSFWIENPNAVEETITATIRFLAYDSIVPGDKLLINSPVLGLNNTGTWTVESIDFLNQATFKLAVDQRAPTPVTTPVTLGASSGLVQIFEGLPSKLFKQIRSIVPMGDLTDLIFITNKGQSKVGVFAGTILQALDKLEFDTQPAFGQNGYDYNTGLIAESNALVYGKESDVLTYPGIAAAGAKINIEGPTVKRIQVALAIRATINTQSIIERVKSEVAAVINNSPIGTPIAISSLVKAAQAVNGVIAVTVLSPLYGAGNDLISVQPFEKPLVLNVDTDVLVSLVG